MPAAALPAPRVADFHGVDATPPVRQVAQWVAASRDNGAVPFVILTMTPFIEQIDPRIEAAARTLGAGTATIFVRILGPLLVPGMLAAGLLVLVRTVGMFELSFFTSGPGTQPLVVVLYYAAFAPGVRASQSIDAMAVIYMGLMLVLLAAALSFVNPTNLVARLRENP